MDLSLQQELAGIPDVRHRVRHLKWFRLSFRRCAALLTRQVGIAFEVDDLRLASAFLNWAERFEQQRRYARLEPRDFAAFASGLLLQELLREKPVEARRDAAPPNLVRRPDIGAIVDLWPSGFVATSYCLSVLNAVAAQDFQGPFALQPAAEDLRIWRSFRENACEAPARAIGYLDLFVGNEPNWAQPDWAPARPRMRRALARLPGDTAARLH